MSEKWEVTAKRFGYRKGETLDLSKGMAFASVDVGFHIAAVLVFGETQRIANARARMIAHGANLLQNRRQQARRRRLRRKGE